MPRSEQDKRIVEHLKSVREHVAQMHREICEEGGQVFDPSPVHLDLLAALDAIGEENEKRANSLEVSIDLPELPKEICQGLLEIGFDTGVHAALNEVLRAEGRTLPVDNVPNPFRRESTTITEPTDAPQDK